MQTRKLLLYYKTKVFSRFLCMRVCWILTCWHNFLKATLKNNLVLLRLRRGQTFFNCWLHLDWWRSQRQTHTNSFQLICENNYFFKYFVNRKFELPPKEWLHPEKFTTFLMYVWTSKRTPCIQIVSLLCGKTS